MRIAFEDHGRFHRGALQVAALSSALACAAALGGWDRLSPATVVLAAALATLALALGHVRWEVDPVAAALARAAAEADADGRALLTRAGAARTAIARAVGDEGALAGSEGRALRGAAGQATAAVAALCLRRQRLAQRAHAAAAPETDKQVQGLEDRAAAASDPAAREAYLRAAGALRERAARAAALGTVIDRSDARLAVAVAELEGAALVAGMRAELGPGDAPAALATACDRLRAAGADLGSECDALAEIGAL